LVGRHFNFRYSANDMDISIAAALLEAAGSLRRAGVGEARYEAGLLLAHVLGRDRTFILTHDDEFLSEQDSQIFAELITRRGGGEPLQYITGRQAFFNLEFEVTKDVLIPRPETELLVETALSLWSTLNQPFLCDVGTGSGCIAISLLHEIADAKAVGLDISPAALRVAKQNADNNAVSDRLQLVESDLFSALKPTDVFPLIVSNPPYVAEAAWHGLQREVRDHEPLLALAAGADGLSVIRRLLQEAPDYLIDGGHFLFEIGFDQHEPVRQMIDNHTWELLDIHKDLQGIPRIVSLRKN
jgi:release factor glutamine methyltransferase